MLLMIHDEEKVLVFFLCITTITANFLNVVVFHESKYNITMFLFYGILILKYY